MTTGPPPHQTSTPAALGLCCAGCQGTAFHTDRRDRPDCPAAVALVCAACGRQRAWITHLAGAPEGRILIAAPDLDAPSCQWPPSAGWRWVGWYRGSDRLWHPVAEGPTLGSTWDVLLHFPGNGDRLVTPTEDTP